MLTIFVYSIQQYLAVFISMYAFTSVVDVVSRYSMESELYPEFRTFRMLLNGSISGGIFLTAYNLLVGRLEIVTIAIIMTLIANIAGILTSQLMHREFPFWDLVKVKGE